MTRDEFIRRYISVHKCVGCGDILDFEHSAGAFCGKCRLAFNASLTVGCPNCFKPARECECMPPALKASGALTLRRLFFYDGENRFLPEIKLLYRMKENNYRRLSCFAAEQLKPLVLEETSVLGLDSEALAVTGVPRGRRNKRIYGFDHMELTARRLGKLLGIEYVRALGTRGTSKTQKTLNAAQRLANAKNGIYIRSSEKIKGKYVILIDDIVTSGASMATCTERLLSSGARGVLCFSLASKNKM